MDQVRTQIPPRRSAQPVYRERRTTVAQTIEPDEEERQTRPGSALRLSAQKPGQRVRDPFQTQAVTSWKPQHRGKPPIVYVVGGMIALVLLWLIASAIGSGLQRWNYGPVPTYQVDAVVGHQDSVARPSHFIATVFNDRGVIIEFPGGNTDGAIDYGSIFFGGSTAPLTLEFRDVNGDRRPDMIVKADGNFAGLMINDGTKFRPVKPGESYSL